MSLLSIAALALQAGPSVIRGISSLFGGNETAENLAKAVEAVDGAVSMSKEQKQIALTRELQAMPPEALVDLERVKVEMEKEITRRQELALQDKQAEHHETQETIRAGDKAADEYVRQTRPKMARQSLLYMVLYVFLFEGLRVNGLGAGADIYIALTIGSIAFAYHGLRTLDGFAPYSKSSGDKVAGALKSVIKGR
ncbi:TPA: DUF190 domain-containing protein [Vibrio parahaemolyticus]|uniref:hypothetical protein n=1 Tax=Vibrio parahaemolyticus TaxID=670 RepID=UPI0020561A98|nr:hypothetical protein [Vibrio parahaemolyticus]UPR17276.1 hypothetical protein H9J99_21055 [Vibrio parahaemolyticus]UPR23260.1 hypothetical protein H9J98_18080 [Vibrio parahaemolyticus]HAV1517128.1 DUF190 domain-containing protein [Vibrio parahaemolyticus]HAV1521811.1 DUF190 domain-containing protein [Vibrio parahaemolyticus]HAV1536092.1 DUF190 domain-containing protein [Vibrio parahaemolyticus]